MDEVCNLMEEHPFDCISYSMTGSWETIISYYSYTGGYSTTTYNGPVCEMKCDEQTERCITTIKKNATSMQCNNPNLYCKGFIINPEKPDEPSKDPEIDKNTCVMFYSESYLQGTKRLLNKEDVLRNYKGNVKSRVAYGPSIFGLGYVKETNETTLLPNVMNRFPTDDVIAKTPSSVIRALEVVVDGTNITRLSGVYYIDSLLLNKQNELKGYNEEVGLIDLTENNRKDIYVNEKSKIGNGNSVGIKKLIIGSFNDSCISGIWYRYSNDSTLGVNSIIGICVAFRRFFDNTFKIEYKGFNEGIEIRQLPSIGNWVGYNCNQGDFISQIEVASLDGRNIDKAIGKEVLYGFMAAGAFIIPALLPIMAILLASISIADALGVGSALITMWINYTGVGFKGFTMFRTMTYNLPERLYKSWIPAINRVRCCNMIDNEKYEPDSIEAYTCKNDLELEYPNGTCKSILQDFCNLSENIDSELCLKACGALGENTINCDIGIKSYCNSDSFMTINTKGQKVQNIAELYKDPVCGCMFEESNIDAYKNLGENGLDNYVDAYKNILNNKMRLDKKNDILLQFRSECSVGVCAQSPYKLHSQKLKLNEKQCNTTEKCLSKGYQIPNTTENDSKIDCSRYLNSSNCIVPVQPKITIINDKTNIECGSLVGGSTLADLRFEPLECEISTDLFPSLTTDEDRYKAKRLCEYHINPETNEEEFMLKLQKQIIRNSYPPDSSELCPPYKRKLNGEIMKDSNGNNVRVQMEEWVPCPYVPSDYKPAEDIKDSGISNRVLLLIMICLIVLIGFVYKYKK